MNEIVTFVTSVWASIQDIPASTWVGFASLLGGGTIVSIVTELYKRHLINKKEQAVAKSFLGLVITALAGVVTLAQSVITYGAINPHFLGQHTPQVLGFASAVYLFGGSATYKKTAAFLRRFKAAFDAMGPKNPEDVDPATGALDGDSRDVVNPTRAEEPVNELLT